MTPRETERRMHTLEGAVRVRHPDPAPPATELERWAATLSVDALVRVERLFRAWRTTRSVTTSPMSELERGLIECACLDAAFDDADPVRRAYLASQPHDPTDPAMAELREWIERWISGPEREFMRGADVRGWLAWHGLVVEALSAGELVRLAAVLQVFEDHPVEAAATVTDVLWAAIGEHGQRKRHGMV